MRRKILFALMVIVTLLSSESYCSADEIYYTNDNGVSLTKNDYDYLSQLYWDGYQRNMTIDDYNEYLSLDIETNSIETTYYDLSSLSNSSEIMPISAVYDSNKTLKISKTCSTKCFISVTVTWNNIPSVRSYDVIGARLSNTSLLTTPKTVTSSTTTTYSASSSNLQKFTNGFGASIKVPASGGDIIFNQNYYVEKSGTVYASYQHAISKVTLAQSKKYSISGLGAGGVFLFDSSVSSKYDYFNGITAKLG